MVDLTRKDFLGFAASAAVAGALSTPGSAKAEPQVKQAEALPSGPPRRTLIRGADVLPMDPLPAELPETDVLIEDGKIAAIGKNLEVGDTEIIDAKGMILMPGMIDGHRHIWHTIDAGRLVKTHNSHYMQNYQQWKMRIIVSLTPEEHYLAGLVGGLIAIDSGVTSLIDYAHGQIDADTAIAAGRGVKDSGIGGWYAFQLGVSPTYKPGDTVSLSRADSQRVDTTTERHWKIAERLQQEVFSSNEDVMQLGLCPAAVTGARLTDIKAEWERLRGMGVPMLAAHIHKPAKPTPEGTMGYRDSGIPDLQEAGLLGPDFHLAHANALTDEELKMLADSGGMVCATAMGEFPYMASARRGPSVHGRARKAGVAAGIGIDVNLVLPLDYFEHVRAAFWNLYLSPTGVEIAESYQTPDVLDFATAMGAKSIRLGGITGTISVGKRADLVLVRTDRITFARQGSLADRVVNFGTTADVDSVWVGGIARKRNGKMIGVDWAKLKADIAKAQDRFSPLADSITFT